MLRTGGSVHHTTSSTSFNLNFKMSSAGVEGLVVDKPKASV